MTFLAPAGFYVFAASALLILLSLLRSRIRRTQVSALFLWTGLIEAPEPRSVRFQRWLDPLLFLQLAVLAALVFALVQPMWKTERTVFRGVALVMDASASMHTRTDSGKTRYELAVDRAREVLAEVSSSRMTLIHYSSQSRVLVPPTSDEDALTRALNSSGATWLSDGSIDSLVDLFSAIGGLEAYDRILLFSDHVPPVLPPGVDIEVFTGGRNVGISAFTVRENLTGSGVMAFLELSNDTAEYFEPQVTIRDDYHTITLSLPLEPMTAAQYVVPFPVSRGTQFTATLGISDDFSADNTRYFALARPSSIRVRWMGPDNRLLRAGIESVLPVTYVGSDEAYDLAVLVNTTIDELPKGNVLLLHSQVTGQIHLGAKQPGGFAQSAISDHPLLRGIEADGIYVEELPSTEFLIPNTPLLSVNSLPLVTDAGTEQRTVLVFSTDLTATNLPITVDFPILLRNMLAGMQRLPSSLVHDWRTTGHLIEAGEFGSFLSARDPSERVIPLNSEQLAITTEEPGFYIVTTQQGVMPVAINVDPAESYVPQGAGSQVTDIGAEPETKETLRRLWPYFALALLVLLIAESLAYVRTELSGGRAT